MVLSLSFNQRTPPFCDAALHWVIELTRWRSLAWASMQRGGDVSAMMSEGAASSSGAELAARSDTAAVTAAARQFGGLVADTNPDSFPL